MCGAVRTLVIASVSSASAPMRAQAAHVFRWAAISASDPATKRRSISRQLIRRATAMEANVEAAPRDS